VAVLLCGAQHGSQGEAAWGRPAAPLSALQQQRQGVCVLEHERRPLLLGWRVCEAATAAAHVCAFSTPTLVPHTSHR
jgi:hypothetical protein